MKKTIKASAVTCLFVVMLLAEVGDCARGGGGGRRGGGRKGTKYGMRMPILIRSRNQEAGNYYEHKDVSEAVKQPSQEPKGKFSN